MTDLAAPLTVIDDSVFRLMVEEIPHIVWMATPDGAMEYVNRQGRVYAGPTVGAVRPAWTTLVHTDDVEKLSLVRGHAQRELIPYRTSCRIRRFDGEYRWHDLSGIPIHDERDGVVNGLAPPTTSTMSEHRTKP